MRGSSMRTGASNSPSAHVTRSASIVLFRRSELPWLMRTLTGTSMLWPGASAATSV